MMNPVGASHAVAHAGYSVQQATSKASPPKPQPTSMPQDKVTIHSKDVDHDGDRK